MIKKLKNWIGRVWALKVIYPYVMKNEVQTALWMRKMIVAQLWHSGLKFDKINLWLVYMGQKKVVEYWFPEGEKVGVPRVTTVHFTPEERAEIKAKGRLIYQVRD